MRRVGEFALPLGVFRDRGADQRRPHLRQHLLLRTFDHRREREHVFLLGDRLLRAFAVDDGGPKIIVAIVFDESVAELRGHVVNAVFLQVGVDLSVDRVGLTRHGESRQRRLRILRRQRHDRPDLRRDRLGDLLPVPRHPDAGAVDAAASAVDEDAVGHQVDVLLPLIDHVVAEDDLAEAGTVSLDSVISLILLDRCRSAEDQALRAMLEHRRADVAEAGVDGDRLFRDAGRDERLRHAVRSPRFLRAGLEDEADLHRNDRQP